jgi:hypothetical protein
MPLPVPLYPQLLIVMFSYRKHSFWALCERSLCMCASAGPWSLWSSGDRLCSQCCPNSQEWASRCQDGCARWAAQTTSWGIGQFIIECIDLFQSCKANLQMCENAWLGAPVLSLQLEKCAQDLGSTSKAVGSSMAQLLTCAAQGNEHYTGRKANTACTENYWAVQEECSPKLTDIIEWLCRTFFLD